VSLLTITIAFITPITTMIYFVAAKLFINTSFVITLKIIATILFVTVIITIIAVITNQIHTYTTTILAFEFIWLAKMVYVYKMKLSMK